MIYAPVVARTVSVPLSSVVTVRDVRGPDELRACQAIQRRAWGIAEEGYLLPVATMAAAQKVGGLVLGAFLPQTDHLLGFSFAFLGRLREKLILYSQLTGVDPTRQAAGIGRALKFEQRRRAREMGIDTIVWAFDPLQASNAAFNLAVLGATCCTYEVDLYGPRSDALNAGLATDRLLAEWSTVHDHAGRAEPWPDAVELIASADDGEQRLRLPARGGPIPADAVHLHIQIPRSIADVKSEGPAAAARDWQLAVRRAFQDALSRGFTATGFSRADPLRPSYLLERTT